jgi:hypothetical protein
MERYLQGKLSADEERAFEETYLADQELLDELILTEKLQQGLKLVGAPAPSAVRERAGGPAWRSFLRSPQYAAAASVLLGLSVLVSVGLLVQNQTLRENANLSGDAAITRLVPLLAVRGVAPAEMDAPGPDEWIVFLLDAAFTEYDDYRATLTRRGSPPRTVRRLDGLAPSYDGYIALGLSGRTLSSGDYEVLLEGRMRDWPADRAYEQISLTPLSIAGDPQ